MKKIILLLLLAPITCLAQQVETSKKGQVDEKVSLKHDDSDNKRAKIKKGSTSIEDKLIRRNKKDSIRSIKNKGKDKQAIKKPQVGEKVSLKHDDSDNKKTKIKKGSTSIEDKLIRRNKKDSIRSIKNKGKDKQAIKKPQVGEKVSLKHDDSDNKRAKIKKGSTSIEEKLIRRNKKDSIRSIKNKGKDKQAIKKPQAGEKVSLKHDDSDNERAKIKKGSASIEEKKKR
jgi:hypothetical protein